MPELPEVEYAARCLRAWMQGRRVERAVVASTRLIGAQQPRSFAAALRGRRLAGVDRHGKYLLLDFGAPVSLMLHLGMTGKLVRRPLGHTELYSHARFELDDGAAVHFRDPRKFGRLRLASGAGWDALPEVVAQLGPDAWKTPPDAERLGALLARTRRPIKVALLDQAVIAGLGNIHAAEALFRAGINPRRRADRLSAEKRARLAAAIQETFAYAFGRMPPIESHADIEYVEEGGENPFLVYDRAGEPCPRCGARIRSLVQGGRTTYYCPRCQR